MTDTEREKALEKFEDEFYVSLDGHGVLSTFLEALFVRAEAGIDETKEYITVVNLVPTSFVLELWSKIGGYQASK